MEFKQSEPTAERRRWIMVLVDSTDGVTGKTGQTGQVYISKNGGTPALSTASIVEVDSTNMPGHYYVQLTPSELNTLGFISITKKNASTLAFHDRAIVSYNDPYTSAGGFSGGGSTTSIGLTKKQLEILVKMVWDYKFSEEDNGLSAKETLIKAADHPNVDLSNLVNKIDAIDIPELNLQPVLDKIDAIDIPEGKDYTKLLGDVMSAVKNMEQVNIKELKKLVSEFSPKMQVATDQINTSLDVVSKIKFGFEELDGLIKKFNEALAEQTDMDRRFGAMGAKLNDQKIEGLVGDIKKLSTQLVNFKYDILKASR